MHSGSLLETSIKLLGGEMKWQLPNEKHMLLSTYSSLHTTLHSKKNMADLWSSHQKYLSNQCSQSTQLLTTAHKNSGKTCSNNKNDHNNPNKRKQHHMFRSHFLPVAPRFTSDNKSEIFTAATTSANLKTLGTSQMTHNMWLVLAVLLLVATSFGHLSSLGLGLWLGLGSSRRGATINDSIGS